MQGIQHNIIIVYVTFLQKLFYVVYHVLLREGNVQHVINFCIRREQWKGSYNGRLQWKRAMDEYIILFKETFIINLTTEWLPRLQTS